MEERELVIIGAGPAGLAAAAEAVRRGVKSILLLERNPIAGGILNQCIHDGFGLERFGQSLSGPEYIERFLSVQNEPGVELVPSAMALRLEEGPRVTYADQSGLHTVCAKAVILATGCRERTRGAIRIPGERPSGVYTAGVVQHLTNIDNVLVGKRAVILGSGDIGLIMARRLTLEGVEVLCVLEKLPYCSGLSRNVRQCLMDYGIPLHLGTTVVEIEGAHRLEAVVAAEVDKFGAEKPNTRRRIPCDTLILSVGLIPENELLKACGAEMDPVTGGALVDGELMTSVKGVFSCGNGLHVHDIVDMVSAEAERAARFASDYILGAQNADGKEQIPLNVGDGVRYALPRKIVAGEETVLSLRVKSPGSMQTVRVYRGGQTIAEKRMRRLSPAEMIRIKLPALCGAEPLCVELIQNECTERAESELVCTVCPNGCALFPTYDAEGKLEIKGASCKRGEAFGRDELTDPRRTLTTTLRVKNGARALVSVKTASQIKKGELMPLMRRLREVSADAPVQIGQTLFDDGVSVVATTSVPRL